MELFTDIYDFVIHLDRYLENLVDLYGGWAYLLIFLVVFCETGLVVMPFLPSDSILFMSGVLAGLETLNIYLLFMLIVAATMLGDSLNYWLGSRVGTRVFDGRFRFLGPQQQQLTQQFFAKYGDKAIILARFVPLMRSFVPFLSGMGFMAYGRFILFNIVGNVIWVIICLFGGYFFGSHPFVQDNFGAFFIGAAVLSLMPAVIEIVREKYLSRRRNQRAAKSHPADL